MGTHAMTSDFLIVGAGSAGCVMASELIRRQAGSVCVLEAGPSERHPLVSMPFGLVWLMGSARDWRFKTVPQRNAGNREISIPRGKMVGGSGPSIQWFGFADVWPISTVGILMVGVGGCFARL